MFKMCVFDDIIKTEDDGWNGPVSFVSKPSPVKKQSSVKRRRLTTLSRGGSRQRSSYDAAKSTVERIRTEVTSVSDFSMDHLDIENKKRLHVLYNSHLNHSASHDEKDDLEEEKDWFQQLWSLCWYYSRQGDLDDEFKTKILLYILEQIPYNVQSKLLHRNTIIERILEDSKNVMILTIEFPEAVDLLNKIIIDADEFCI